MFYAYTMQSTSHTRKNKGERMGSLVTSDTILLLPLLVGGLHWVLVEFDFRAKKAQVYDSLLTSSSRSTEQALNQLLTWLVEHSPCARPRGAWRLECTPQPSSQQPNEIDCGP